MLIGWRRACLSLLHCGFPLGLQGCHMYRLPPQSPSSPRQNCDLRSNFVDSFRTIPMFREDYDNRRLHSAQRRTHSEAVSATSGRTFYGQSSAATRSKAGAFWARNSHDDCPVDECATAISLPQYSRWSISLLYRTSACWRRHTTRLDATTRLAHEYCFTHTFERLS
jgi:hypothetical protein